MGEIRSSGLESSKPMPGAPRGPFRYEPSALADARSVNKWSAVIGAALLALGFGMAWMAWNDLRKDQQLAARADASASAEVSGSVRSTGVFLIHSHAYRVRFLTQDGREIQRHVDYTTFFGKGDRGAAPRVRYLRAKPEEFVLDWAITAAPWRWVSVVADLLLVGLLAGGGMLLFARHRQRMIDGQLRMLGRAQLEWARVLKSEPIQSEQRCYYVLQGEDESKPHAHDYKAHEAPLFDAGARRLLVLADPERRERPLVPRKSAHPLALTAEQRAAWDVLRTESTSSEDRAKAT